MTLTCTSDHLSSFGCNKAACIDLDLGQVSQACQKIRYGTVFQCYLIDFQKSRPFTTLSPCSASRKTAALIALKIGLCQSPLAACRLPLAVCCLLLAFWLLLQLFFFSIFFSLLVVVFVVVTVLFNYNYLFNHNFVRVSTIINHQMHHADSGRQNSVTGPTVSLTDWPLSARAANRKPEKEMEHGAWSCSAWSGHVECASCPSRSHCRSLSLSYCCSSCLAQKSSVSSSRTPQLSSQQSVSQSAR